MSTLHPVSEHNDGIDRHVLMTESVEFLVQDLMGLDADNFARFLLLVFGNIKVGNCKSG